MELGVSLLVLFLEVLFHKEHCKSIKSFLLMDVQRTVFVSNSISSILVGKLDEKITVCSVHE